MSKQDDGRLKDLREKLRFLKDACWGIGLSDVNNPNNFMVSGTGFAIDPEGFLLTASHVIKELMEERDKLKVENIQCAITAFKVTVLENSNHPIILKRGFCLKDDIYQ